jgi:hypothetical protein
MFEFALFKVYAPTEMHGPKAEEYIRSMLRDVEILSAKRSREKAIEECIRCLEIMGSEDREQTPGSVKECTRELRQKLKS